MLVILLVVLTAFVVMIAGVTWSICSEIYMIRGYKNTMKVITDEEYKENFIKNMHFVFNDEFLSSEYNL